MSHLCTNALLITCAIMPAVLFAESGPRTASIARVILQLGSPKYKERQAANKALRGIGLPALHALRKAAKGNNDVELWARARRLVRVIEDDVVAEVKKNKLNGQEKIRRLRTIIRPGMSMEEVHQRLGKSTFWGTEALHEYELFLAYSVIVVHYQGKVSRLDQWGD
jgi:hypothetical protein